MSTERPTPHTTTNGQAASRGVEDRPRPRLDPLLVEPEPGSSRISSCLLGNEAIVRGALEAGVAFASGYPGTPSSEVTDSLARVARARDIVFEYSVNEKICLEMAYAASLAGARSICAMKHLGLMVAGDPLSTIPYTGVVAGMVIVSAGDPSCLTSPNEQDQRHLGPMLHLPTLDPSTAQDAYEMAKLAFELSEESQLPVLLRITTRVAHTRATVHHGHLGRARVTGFVRDRQRFVPIPVNARRLRPLIPGRLDVARRYTADLLRVVGGTRGGPAILAAGAPAATCADLLREQGLGERVALATVGGVHPLPEVELVALLREHDPVLVLEELSPFLEDAVAALVARNGLATTILGKRSGHLPEPFEYTPPVIRRGLHDALGLGSLPAPAPEAVAVAPRPPTLCSSCPHRSAYFAARAAFAEDQLYFNDIGCYTLGYGEPLDTVDALLCMGAGFTLAAGVARVTGQRTVGFLGDSTFFHSGMPALLNAIKEDVGMVAVILDNDVTAMTGFQESPTVEVSDGAPTRRTSIEAVVRALGARHVERVDPADLAAAIAAFERARDASGLSVVITEHPCPVFLDRLDGDQEHEVFEIDHDRCQRCGREANGMRCDQDLSRGLERHMARGRALATLPLTANASHVVAPCATRCPLGLCVQGYAGHIAAGQYREALELIMSRCPLPDSVCRVCDRPCEDVCVRAELDEPVAINDLKRFVMDWAATAGESWVGDAEPDNGRSVAVVGAGPAGLAAAPDLRLRGYAVTMYDAGAAPGGLLRSGIPDFRLPPAALERDCARILELGVRFVGETRLGIDRQLDDLLAEHDAVFLAIGAHRALPLDLTGAGAGAPQVIDALGYLARAQRGEAVATGDRVVVLGGGNAAIDAARTARRRGAEHVAIVYRRRRADMPALGHEVDAAEREGIAIRDQLQPLRLQAGAEPAIACVGTEPGEPDASGRRRPEPVAGSELSIPADQVIVAIGQAVDRDFDDGAVRLARHEDGRLVVDPESGRTSHERVFAGGDMVPSVRTVTAAIALGQRAAWGIDASLRDRAAADRRAPPPLPQHWPPPPAAPRLERADGGAPRARPPEQSAAAAVAGFDEVVSSLSETQARAEAARCAVCGQCGNCRACLDLFGCPAFYLDHGRIYIDARLCTGCAVCADLCPNEAIRPAGDA